MIKQEELSPAEELNEELSDEVDESTETFDQSEEKADEEDLAQLKAQIDELKEANLRDHADFENIKKRLEKEKYQAIEYSNEQFARDLLPIIDALESAISSASSDEEKSDEVVKKYKEGMELTIEQFHKCFEKYGIKPVACEGEFDPNVHEAIMKTDSEEVQSGHIVQTLQKGYTIKDRILRAAMVSIAN